MVYPSGLLACKKDIATAPEAPGLFVHTTGTPKSS